MQESNGWLRGQPNGQQISMPKPGLWSCLLGALAVLFVKQARYNKQCSYSVVMESK